MQGMQFSPESKPTKHSVMQAAEASFPLAPLQEGMLFQALLSDQNGDSFYIMQRSIELREPVDQALLEKALSVLLNRHPSLSASFHTASQKLDSRASKGRPYQRFHAGLRVPVDVVSLAATDKSARKAEFEQFLVLDRRRAFDLATPPLMRATIIEDEVGRADLVLTFHHILMDGRSVTKFIYELFEVMDAERDHRAANLGPKPREYSDYLQFCAEKNHEESLGYFRKLLAGKHTPTAVPLAESVGRPLADTGYAEIKKRCSEDVFARARSLAESTHTTLGTVVQAMWSLLLSRYSGDQDVIFGNTRAGRGAFGPDAAEMVGLFINTVVVRADVSDTRTVKDLLHSLREQSLAIRPHETIPLSAVFGASDVEPGAPLFETLLVFEKRSFEESLVSLGGDKWNGRAGLFRQQPPFPLTLNVVDGANPEFRILFDRKRLTESAVHRLLESCEHVLNELTLDPHRSLTKIDVVPSHERNKILYEWNDTAYPFSDQACIHQLFEARVDLQPGAPAVEVHGKRFTYRELEERANRLAQVLLARDIEPGRYIGICLSRGVNLITTMLAIAKAGAAYVPIDPNYPAERQRLMLNDVNASLVITEVEYEGTIEYKRFVLDGADNEEWSRASSERPPKRVESDSQCYTIFTSGSTGHPKGVVLSHRAVVNTLEWVNREFQVQPSDRLLFVTSPCFDLSVYDVFGVLGAGGTVVVATEDILADPEKLSNLLVEANITIWDSAPAALQRLAPFFRASQGESLRLCMLSGDWVPLSLPDAIRTAFPAAQIMSLGGATEAAIWSNWFPVKEVQERWASIPYGKPIQNARYHVLDRRLKPVPVGVPGELFIGGVCLADGYLGNEKLTAKRFIKDPFREEENARLYRTGDLARYHEDGNLEFLGRFDFQRKIRGFRVEMGEVEAVISQVPGVQVAICEALPDKSGQNSLVAYVVTQEAVNLEEEALKAYMAKKLPSFMIPSRILFLDALPTTSNGKVDRKALPDPQLVRDPDKFVPPEGHVEKGLAQIWCDILELERVSARDNFFAIGGNSLLAVMLIIGIKEKFLIDFPLARLFTEPTIRGCASLIEECEQKANVNRHLQAFNRAGSRPPLVLIPGLVGTAYTFHALRNSLGPDQPVYVIDLLAVDSADNFPDTIEGMANLYEQEIIETCESSSIVLGGFSFGSLIAYELARRLKRKGYDVPFMVSFDGFAPGYPHRLPMIRRIKGVLKELGSRDIWGKLQYLKDRSIFKRKETKWIGLPGGGEDLPSDPRLQEHIKAVLEVQFRARQIYSPTRIDENLNLLLIRAHEMPYFGGVQTREPLYGWHTYVNGKISLVTYPGDHYNLWEGDNRDFIIDVLSKSLACITPQSSETRTEATTKPTIAGRAKKISSTSAYGNCSVKVADILGNAKFSMKLEGAKE
ncbi:amino acid adenylation domain-containing protein [Microbulbifer sp. MCCC 1A16149]|uniref:amino acid adenylation domain-containing protein n=1 Tax=Microbulbifer sp. MCCC 1A16149 TaxID=3411322 RepID=UPI003D0E715C